MTGRQQWFKVRGWTARAVGLAILAVIVFSAVKFVAPGVFVSAGLPVGYGLSALRWGYLYTEARPGAWLIGSPKSRSSLALAFRGEELVVRYDLDIERGWATIAVRPGLVGSQAVHVEHIRASSRDFARIRMPGAGLYRVSASYTFGFRGRNEMSWTIE